MPKKITDLPSLSSADSTDIVPLVDQSTNTTKQVTVGGLFAGTPDGAFSASKLDSNAVGHGFLEIKRTTLNSTSDTITVSSIPEYKYLHVIVNAQNSGSIALTITFNNDTASNYARRVSVNGGSDVTATGSTAAIATSTGSTPIELYMEIVNETSVDKMLKAHMFARGTAGSAAAPTREEWVCKWANTSTKITRIDVTNGSTGDFASGSEVIVFGKN